MWGFLLGSLGLVVAYSVLQPAAADRLASGGNVIASMFTRFLSEGVAGLPTTKAGQQAAAQAKAAGKLGLSAEDTGAPTQSWASGLVSPKPSPNSPGVTTGPQDPTLGGILPR